MLVTRDNSLLQTARKIFHGLACDPDNHIVSAEEVNQWPISQRVAIRLFRPIKQWF
jgi:hypothetical protein